MTTALLPQNLDKRGLKKGCLKAFDVVANNGFCFPNFYNNNPAAQCDCRRRLFTERRPLVLVLHND